MSEYNINDILDKTLEIINAQLLSKNIELVKNIEEFKLLSIENELILVLVNILNNAADALILNGFYYDDLEKEILSMNCAFMISNVLSKISLILYSLILLLLELKNSPKSSIILDKC